MSESDMKHVGALRLRLPATSANLGPGFDAAAIAYDFFLEIEAMPATEFSIDATGRDADRCGRVEDNLILEIYKSLLIKNGRPVTPLAIRMKNGIPLGMGCGSSAAGRLAAIALAVHFGQLGWTSEQILEEATELEGHPDNVAACALGYLTVSAVDASSPAVLTATCGEGLPWKLLLVLPLESLPTEKARALLPAQYSRADVVSNVQRTSLLVAAFALGRGDLLRVAMQDRLHQPYRMEACPLLRPLLPLAGTPGILGVALSGAGPAVLLVVEPDAPIPEIVHRIRCEAEDPSLEIVETGIGCGASQSLRVEPH